MSDDAEFTLSSQAEVHTDLAALFRGAVRVALEVVLEQELRALVGAGRYQRLGDRKDHRNGTYLRRLVTSVGGIELDVPRSRAGGGAGAVLGRYQRRTDEVDAAIVESYVAGVSTRKMSKVTRALLGDDVSRSTVSRVTRSLDEQVEALRKAPISEPMTYLFLDGTFLDARWARRVENVAALVAYGVDASGHRQLLGITIGPRESEEGWADLLGQLVARGLRGVKLVVADGHAGLAAAVRHQLPEAELQRCVVHLERNVFAKAPRKLWKRLGRELRHLFDATSLADAKKRLATFKGGLGAQLPEALAILEAGFAAGTRFYAFPRAHWLRIRSTNGLERLHGEIKRRIRAVGAFPDRASALRLVTVVALRATGIWADRRYLDMALLDENHQPAEAKLAA
jgi:transposase-like protein